MPGKTTNASRIRAHKALLREAGMVRLDLWVLPELRQYLIDHRLSHECYSMTLARLLLQIEKKPLQGIRIRRAQNREK